MKVQFTAAARTEAMEAFDYYFERSERVAALVVMREPAKSTERNSRITHYSSRLKNRPVTLAGFAAISIGVPVASN